jgi:RNase P/RNase MRP subunit p30
VKVVTFGCFRLICMCAVTLNTAFALTVEPGSSSVSADACAWRQTRRVQQPHVVSRKARLHDELRCPSCGLHLSASLDLESYIRSHSDTRATRAIVEHRRCGARFTMTFDDVSKGH